MAHPFLYICMYLVLPKIVNWAVQESMRVELDPGHIWSSSERWLRLRHVETPQVFHDTHREHQQEKCRRYIKVKEIIHLDASLVLVDLKYKIS